MKDILLITNYWHFECEKSSSRYYTLANMLAKQEVDLEIVTSTFYHATKSQRQYDTKFLNSFPYKMTLIYERGYSNNVDIKRILSHKEFARNVLNYLKQRKKPDVIYCVVPSLDVANVVTKYANNNGIRVIIDIQDLWPEAYQMVFNVPIISDILFKPFKNKADKIYAAADEIVAVSETYVNRALKVNKKCKRGNSIFLGTELPNFDKIVLNREEIDKPSSEIWIAYIGTLGYSYDITCVIDSLKVLKDRGVNNIKFIVMGNGPLKNKFEEYANQQRVNVEFTGALTYSKMVGILTMCDIAVNPITQGAAQSIINKHADYVAAGLPILNTQESLEFRRLIENYNAGINCKNNDPDDLAKKLLMLCENEDMRKTMGINSRKLAEEKFDRTKTYQKLVQIICEDR